jgi:hypothetical protein
MAEAGKTREIVVKPGHVIVGEVRDGFVHVTDIIHDGVSEVSLTGNKPDLTPIPVARIEKIRRDHGLLEPIVDD